MTLPGQTAANPWIARLLSNRWSKWVLMWLAFTTFAFLQASNSYTVRLNAGYDPKFVELLTLPLAVYWIWAALTPVIAYVWQRFPIKLDRVSIPAHLLASMAVVLLHPLLRGPLHPVINMQTWQAMPFNVDTYWRLVVNGWFNNLWMYWSILAVIVALDYYQRWRMRELEASQLETELAHAELQVLRMQLHPHFLFNTLHAIGTLMHKDVAAAEQMLVRLSDLLRTSLDKVGAQEVTLKEELDLLESYVGIQQMRFQDRMEVDVEVQPEVLDALVPNLLLQPLVENAVVHGITPYSGKGRITIRAVRDGDRLNVIVHDTGPGMSVEREMKKGVGLNNTRARLLHLYGNEQSFYAGNASEGGWMVQISIPFRGEPAYAEPVGDLIDDSEVEPDGTLAKVIQFRHG